MKRSRTSGTKLAAWKISEVLLTYRFLHLMCTMTSVPRVWEMGWIAEGESFSSDCCVVWASLFHYTKGAQKMKSYIFISIVAVISFGVTTAAAVADSGYNLPWPFKKQCQNPFQRRKWSALLLLFLYQCTVLTRISRASEKIWIAYNKTINHPAESWTKETAADHWRVRRLAHTLLSRFHTNKKTHEHMNT